MTKAEKYIDDNRPNHICSELGQITKFNKEKKMAEIKSKTGASFSNTYAWDGKELKPKISLKIKGLISV